MAGVGPAGLRLGCPHRVGRSHIGRDAQPAGRVGAHGVGRHYIERLGSVRTRPVAGVKRAQPPHRTILRWGDLIGRIIGRRRCRRSIGAKKGVARGRFYSAAVRGDLETGSASCYAWSRIRGLRLPSVTRSIGR